MRTLCLILTLIPVLNFFAPVWAGVPDDKAESYVVTVPPKPGSKQFEADFAELHQWQNSDRNRECKLSSEMRYPSFKSFYDPKFEILTAAEFSRVEAEMKKLMKYTERVTVYFKKLHQRPRPYDTDPTLKPCVDQPKGSLSYPSSHASEAYATACVLADQFPKKRKKILEWGEYLAQMRVVVGVHHPSDVAASKDLADQICERYLQE